MPQPTGKHGHGLLGMVWSYFGEHRTWPTFEEIDRSFYAATGMQFETAVQQLCPALLRGLDPDVSRTPQPSQQVSLTVAGVANCTGARATLRMFLAMVRTAATIEPHFRPSKPGEQPMLVRVDLKNAPGIDPETGSKRNMFAAAAIGLYEPCFNGGSHNASELEWALYYDRRIRPFNGVQSLEDYWQIRTDTVGWERTEADEQPFSYRSSERASILSAGAEISAALATSTRPVPTTPPTPAPETVEVTLDLHPLIAAVAAKRFENGHYLDAVVHSFKAVEYRVQNLLGSREVGDKLMSAAVGMVPPAITVTRSTGHSLHSEQIGMRDLFKGAMQALRNPRAHGPDDPDDPEEAKEMLVFASFLMRRLDIEDDKRKSSAPAL
jgi:uncharacterized protein (TIGR02391 family)